MRNSSWKDWFGAEVGFSIYIHRRGFTSSTTNSNQPSQLPPKARRRGAPTRPTHAPYARALRTRPTHAPYARAIRLRLTPAPYARALRPPPTPARPTPARPKPARFTPRAMCLRTNTLGNLTRERARENAQHRESETGHPPHQDGPLANYPTAEPHNPLGRSAATTRHWGCCGSSLPSCVRPSVMPDASWLLTEGRKPPPRPMEQLSAPAQRRQCGVGWRGSRRASCVAAAC